MSIVIVHVMLQIKLMKKILFILYIYFLLLSLIFKIMLCYVMGNNKNAVFIYSQVEIVFIEIVFIVILVIN